MCKRACSFHPQVKFNHARCDLQKFPILPSKKSQMPILVGICALPKISYSKNIPNYLFVHEWMRRGVGPEILMIYGSALLLFLLRLKLALYFTWSIAHSSPSLIISIPISIDFEHSCGVTHRQSICIKIDWCGTRCYTSWSIPADS